MSEETGWVFWTLKLLIVLVIALWVYLDLRAMRRHTRKQLKETSAEPPAARHTEGQQRTHPTALETIER